jgi:hypothetical protein
VGKNKKWFDETLQETRSHNTNKLRYRKRLQQEQEAEEEMKNFDEDKDASDTFPETS